MRFPKFIILTFVVVTFFLTGNAQQTNPVERQVANPITDTPNVNPISAEQNISAPKPKTSFEQEGGDGELVVYSEKQTVEGEEGKRILVHDGNVDVRFGIYRMQADKITIYEAENKLDAEGSVVFDQGDDQRITGARAIWNYKTKLGVFEDSTGFTNQTNDGTVIYFTAERVERTRLDEVVVTKGKFTACEEAVPKWSFTADEATIRVNDKIKLKNGKFRVKDIPIVPLPYASIPIKQRDRASGFLTPTFGFSGNKGVRLSGAYFQTLGRSADVTFRGDLYSSRGIGYGLDLRTRANSRSYFNFGFYAVKDRILGANEDADHPDQGGSIVYGEGVHYFSNGFTAAADVRLTSSLAFRQEFSDGVQQIISPIEVSQAFVNKSWDNYTLNMLVRSQVISIPNVRVKTRNLPSVSFEKRPSMLSFFKPAYFSFKTSIEGVSRREEVDDLRLYAETTGGGSPVITPAVGQRFDAYPQISIPINTKYFNFTATGAVRATYYSNSFNDMRRVIGRDVIRKYGEFEFDIRPVALAKNYYGENNSFRFRHVIEPFLTYRYIKGVDNFNRIIRFDYLDTLTDTNELEFGVTNRIYTRRYAEAVTDEAQRRLAEAARTIRRIREGIDTVPDDLVSGPEEKPVSVQPYEIFSLTVRGKYFFDKTFGGALIPGQRNQIAPITALSFYTFGGVPRRFSPLNIDATFRPQRTIFFNTRMDVGVNGDGVRAISAAVGYETPLLKVFQTFYYTRAVSLMPSLAQFANPNGKEPGTLRGSQWSPSVFVGNRDRGPYGGVSLFLDFENRRERQLSPLISSLYTLGYAYDCCAVAVQYYTFNVGARNENRFVFSFRLNGIGAFGTEQFGQGLR
ncbi:MAG: LPS-assembly protein LptD [Saprospiraceae bacterium]|nr:LPS-assembly protein LptD [Pyrinomonadaceae bacterium]